MAGSFLMPVDVGDLAPELDLPDHAGGRFRLADHRGHPVLVIFHRHLA
jgi:peroxiredoxin